jgi:hypothetical protein
MPVTNNQEAHMNHDLWARWATHYSEHGIDPALISRDGIIRPESFKKAPRKILFVLKETNKYAGGNLQDYLSKGPKSQMWYAVSRWAAGLLNNFPRFEEINQPHVLTDSIHSIAAINLKKVTGGASAWWNQINLYAHFDRDLLAEQIKFISPQIIVACGTFDILVWLLDIDINPNNIRSRCHQVARDNLLLINWRHPTRAGGSSSYNQLRNECANSLTSLGQKAGNGHSG